MLTDRIHLLPLPSSSTSDSSTCDPFSPSSTLDPSDSVLAPEDYLSTALGVIFPDDIINMHGDALCPVIYRSPQFGDIRLSLADPKGEETRRLFSHHVWNAGVQMAGFVEDGLGGDAEEGDGGMDDRKGGVDYGKGMNWDVHGHTVLELGAGTGLAGIVAAKAGAREVVVSDYPAEEVLRNLQVNVERNLGTEDRQGQVDRDRDGKKCWVVGHEWGQVPDGLEEEEDEEGGKEKRSEHGGQMETEKDLLRRARERGERGADSSSSSSTDPATTNTSASPAQLPSTFPSPTIFATTHHHFFTRILSADCLWMPWAHTPLRRSIAHFLSPNDGRAWVIAGFHTGRAKLAGFFDEKELKRVGLVVERIWERDAEGREREWVTDRGYEDVTERKRWLVIAVLKHVEQA
jgi:hypothetical protein